MRTFAIAALVAALAAPALAASTPAPKPAGPSKAAPKALVPHLPATAEHTEFVVETNAKGQVTRVRSGKSAKDLAFNAMTYGNALQTFIRTTDGRAVAGTYRLRYDYNPSTKRVRRTVELVRAGGVNPNATGAVDEMARTERKREALDIQAARAAEAKHPPKPTPTADLPDFSTITGKKK